MIGCACFVCRSGDPRDNRTRASALISHGDFHILVDTGPDLRLQALRHGVSRIQAVLFTHAHADHIMGFDDLRRFCDLNGGSLPIYGNESTLAKLAEHFPYAFGSQLAAPGYVHVIPHIPVGTFCLGGLDVTPLALMHGRIECTGWLFERNGKRLVAYLTDCNDVPLTTRQGIHGVEVLVIDGLRDEPHPTHFTISEAIDVARKVEARRTYITHLTHHRSHSERIVQMPDGTQPAYDGLIVDL